ncbi:hypothetical protein JNUCC1_02606 [Lentibacillus sp. JNUCC-1]|nr:hypothetical protein [Lentibacillus sp. JNUCC-1]
MTVGLLDACSGKDEESGANAEAAASEENNANTEADAIEEDETDTEEEEVIEEETFANEVNVLDVGEVLLDQEAVSDFNEEDTILIEHEEHKYVESEFVTSLLDYEITYDPEKRTAEVYKGKGDFTYEPMHEEEEGALLDVGQFYLESMDDYFAPSDDEVDQYKFIEFEGKLYLPERLIMKHLETPVNYLRRDQTVEFGLRGEPTDVYDLGVGRSHDSMIYITNEATDVTIDGENYEQGIKMTEIDPISRKLQLHPESNYKKFSGFLYHKEGDDPMELRLLDSEREVIEVIGTIKPGEKIDFEFDVSGRDEIYISAENTQFKVTDMEAVLIGELQ